MSVELRIPRSGESISEVQIGQWLKSEGDMVERDEILVEIETDKASMELPSPVSGRLAKVLKQNGEAANVGDVIAVLEENGAATGGAASAAKPADTPPPPPPARTPPAAQAPPAAAASAQGQARIMPAAERLMAQTGISPDQVQPTGPGGRILKEDVQRAAGERPAAPAPSAAPAAAPQAAPPPSPRERRDEVVPMTLVRRTIAQRLVEAQHTGALLTTFNEIDMTPVIELRKQYQEAFTKKHGVKLGFMSFFVKAACTALQRFPEINAEIDGKNIIYHHYCDIGVAVSTEKGLMVPPLRNAESMSFAEIEKAIEDLARRGREGKLKPEELQGGTFTITNGGVFGSLLSTPIINPPQSGILGLHAIQERPVVRDGQIVIRSMMYVALTYDHRIVDGKGAVSFLKTIKELVEDPARLLLDI